MGQVYVYDDVSGQIMTKDELTGIRATRGAPQKQTASIKTEVQRGRWRIDRKTGELIDVNEWSKRYQDTRIGLEIIKDVEPYKSIVSGEVIGGRKQHRDHLRGRGLVEIGNDSITRKPLESPGGIAPDIIRAAQEMGHWKP